MTRLAVLWGLASTAYVITQTIDNALLAVGMISGALIGMGVIWKKGIQPTALFVRKASRAVDALFDLRDHQRDNERRFEQIEGRLEVVERHLEADVTVRHEITSPHHPPA